MIKQPKPRQLTSRGAAVRARIVEAAADLIYSSGVGGTSLDDVMAASGVSKSQLYHYFADKDALIDEVIALQTERVLVAQQPHLDALELSARVATMARRDDRPEQSAARCRRLPGGFARQRAC